MDKPAEFNRRRKQFNVRFAPLGSIGKLIGSVEYALQSTEPGIPAQRLALISVRRSLLNTEAKGNFYRLNVVAHCL